MFGLNGVPILGSSPRCKIHPSFWERQNPGLTYLGYLEGLGQWCLI